MKSPNRCRFVPINRHRCVDFPSKVSFKIPCEITLFQGCDVCNECSCLIVMRHLLNKIEMGIFDFPFDSKRVIMKKPHVNAYRHSGWLSFNSIFDTYSSFCRKLKAHHHHCRNSEQIQYQPATFQLSSSFLEM